MTFGLCENIIAFEIHNFHQKDPHPVVDKRIVHASSKQTPGLKAKGVIPLWEKLRRLRLDIARRHGLPPFVVFHDRTLKEMVAVWPKSHDDLLGITGIGEKKAEQYGDPFLSAINAPET